MIFRDDITGLRGLSVILIFLYHFNNNIIPGGLIGVDIFFVITGYFITRSICNSDEKKIFSFLCYYSNRIKRLLPACLFLWTFLIIIYNITIDESLIYDIF